MLGLLCLAEDRLRFRHSAENLETELDRVNTDLARVHSELTTGCVECWIHQSHVLNLERQREVVTAEKSALSPASTSDKAAFYVALHLCMCVAGERDRLAGVLYHLPRLLGRIISLVQLFMRSVR